MKRPRSGGGRRTPRGRHRVPLVWRVVLAVGEVLFRLPRLRLRFVGLDRVPARGGAVLAVTHFGYLDFALLQWGVWRRHRRVVRFLVTSAAFDHPVAGPLLRAMGHIRVDRENGAGGFRAACRVAAAGDLVGVFPEGRVSRSWTLLPLAPGACGIAERTGVPLLPVVVWGGHRLLTRGRRPAWAQARGAWVSVEVDAPLPPAGDPYRGRDALARRLSVLLDRAQRGDPGAVAGAAGASGASGAWWAPAHRGGSAPTPEEAWAQDLRAGIVTARTAPSTPDCDPRNGHPC